MLSMIFKRVSMLGGLAILLCASAFAQTGPIEGTVKIKGADGVTKPAEGITVTIYRTDIAGKWDVKTDKSGHYVRLGMPLAGTFIVVFSGPGARPTYLNNIRIVQSSVVDIVLDTGDGGTITLDEVRAALNKAKGGAGPAQPQQPQVSAADKAKVQKEKDDYEKAVKESKEVQGAFDVARTRYNTGIGMMQANNYSAALSEFEAASGVDTAKHLEFLRLAYKADANIAEAHYQIGVDLFNKKQKPEAKEHFEKAVASVSKAIELASTDTTEPNNNNDLLVYYGIYAKNALLLIEHYGQADKVPTAVGIFDKAVALDATNKNKWAAMKGDTYRYAGMTDEASAAYKAVIAADPTNIDAMYGLGLTLIASSETKVIQEGANALGDFVAKAPATDKRVPAVKEALEAVKNAYKIEAEKPTKRGTKGKP
jgi:tetratricopeptide (TPR) repeat protein